MITEHALLPVVQGREHEFEQAFTRARTIIEGMPGCEEVQLLRCLERPGTYLLLVQWRDLADHTVGFRGSPEYAEWGRLLHGFYDPFPVVEHFTAVME